MDQFGHFLIFSHFSTSIRPDLNSGRRIRGRARWPLDHWTEYCDFERQHSISRVRLHVRWLEQIEEIQNRNWKNARVNVVLPTSNCISIFRHSFLFSLSRWIIKFVCFIAFPWQTSLSYFGSLSLSLSIICVYVCQGVYSTSLVKFDASVFLLVPIYV